MPGLILAAPVSAHADLLRAPASGVPAIAVDLPSSWKARIDNDLSISVYCPAGCAVLATINEVSSETSLSDYASSTLRPTGAGPIYKREAGTIDGRVGEKFTANIKASNGAVVILSLTVVRIGSSHVAVMLQQCVEDATREQLDQVRLLDSRIRVFVGSE